MAISMKSLASNSLDEEDFILSKDETSNVIITQEECSVATDKYSPSETTNCIKVDSTTLVDQEYSNSEKESEDTVVGIHTENSSDDKDDRNLFNKKRRSLDLRVRSSSGVTGDDSKSRWLKEQVSGSFKRLSARISPGNSLDNSLSDCSFEDDGRLKGQSKSLSDGGLSKKEKVKEHFNSYFNKSKKLYQQSTTSTETPSIAIPTTTTAQSDKVSISNDKTSSPPTDSNSLSSSLPTQERSPSPAVNVSSSFAYDDNYLPFISNPPEPFHESSKTTNELTDNSGGKINKKESQQLNKTRIKKEKAISLAYSDIITFSQMMKSPTHSPSTPEPPSVIETVNEGRSIEQRAEELMQEDLKYQMTRKVPFQISFTQLWISAIVLFLYVISFLPSYLTGFISGALFMFLMFSFTIWLISPSVAMYSEYKKDLKEFIADNDSKEKNLLQIKNLPKPENLQKPRDLKGWMGVGKSYEDYNFQKELNQDVYAVLHNEFLFVFISKENIDSKTKKIKITKKQRKNKKRAASHFDSIEEQGPAFIFEEQWTINLSKCQLKLKPDDLPIRRMWNKKYPMKLIIPANELIKRNIDLSLEDLTLSLNDIIEGVDLATEEAVAETNSCEEMFFLFGNTGREKEDWFYRMQLCVKPLKHQFGVDDTSKTSEPRRSYPHYMVELITESEKVMQRNEKGKKIEPYLAWLNIFLGRAFWDFWHDKYWTNKLHQKIQTRLSKINTPPFITNITLTDLNCGHNIPIIHKGSVPVLDEYGIWTDLQITYKGYFTLTLETQLNVDYYVDLVSSIVKQKAGVDPKNHSELSKLTKMSEISNDSISSSLDESEVDDVNSFREELEDVYFEDDVDPLDPLMKDPRTKAFLESRAGKKVVGVVGWIAKSKLAKRVAETDFAKKAYEKAYEKFRKMPIILKVEIQSVRGNLAVNIPPPPTNRLWFGFRGNPVIFITASPKVGEKQVRLTYLTNWIEKKLKEEFKKYLVLPSMQDLSIKLMDSQLANLYPDRPTS